MKEQTLLAIVAKRLIHIYHPLMDFSVQVGESSECHCMPNFFSSIASYVSAMVPVKSPKEYYVQQEVIVLFCETVERYVYRGTDVYSL